MSNPKANLAIVATIIKPHGIVGEVVVERSCDSPGVFEPGYLLIGFDSLQAERWFEIERSRPHQGRLLLKFVGVDSRSSAEPLRGIDLCTETRHLAALGPDEYYLYEIVGAQVLDVDGKQIGTVSAIMESGPSVLLRIQTGETAFLLPFVDEFVLSVDRQHGVIVIRNYQQLIDLEQ